MIVKTGCGTDGALHNSNNNSPGQGLHDELHVSVPRHDPLQAQAQLGVRLAAGANVANIFPPCIRYFHLSTAW